MAYGSAAIHFINTIIIMIVTIVLIFRYFVPPQKRKATALALSGIAVLIILSKFIYYYWMPVKYAVKEERFHQYTDCILIEETHYTGTGWRQVGDESGYFSEEEIKDVHITGSCPPYSEMMQSVNVFLCEVNYEGKLEFTPTGEIVDTYTIIEWHPVYPVIRDSLAPKLFLPKSFMSKRDIPSY